MYNMMNDFTGINGVDTHFKAKSLSEQPPIWPPLTPDAAHPWS